LVLRLFKATSILPLQPNVILQQFTKDTPESSITESSSSSVYSGDEWLKIKTLMKDIVKDPDSKKAKKVNRLLYYLTIQNTLLKQENRGLRDVYKT
jgi:hypothetical protein